jgi:methionine-rich copper-binding protein CopC
VLTGPNEQQITVTQENDDDSQLIIRFVSLIQSGLYTLTVTPQDIAGNTAQSTVPYPFRLEFEVPGLSSVKANTADASVELAPYAITEISESISSFTLEFTDATRIDFENTRVVLTGPNEQQITVTQENDDDSQLIIRFVSLIQSGLYTLTVTPQDIAGNTAQSTVPYPFRLEFEVPGLSSVKANTADASVELE